jgi:hypothetical protein
MMAQRDCKLIETMRGCGGRMTRELRNSYHARQELRLELFRF